MSRGRMTKFRGAVPLCGLAAVALSLFAVVPPAAGQDNPMPLTRRVKVGSSEAYYFFPSADNNAPRPVLVVVPAAVDPQRGAALSAWRQMQAGVEQKGWRLLIPSSPKLPLWSDWGALAVREIIDQESDTGAIDRSRVYLLALGSATPAAFSLVSRLPDMWAAAIAVEGDPRPAIDNARLFAANAAGIPFLWVANEQTQQTQQSLIEKLRQASFPVDITKAENLNLGQVIATFENRQRPEAPETVDFETDSLQFSRCYWVEITALDAGLRNDVLGESRVKPGSGAALSIGPFGYNLAEPGPGVEVSWLPPDYKGPLKLQDRIVAIRGKEVADPPAYQKMMDAEDEPADAAVTVERGGRRIRLENRILLPNRVIPPTARVKAERTSKPPGIQIVSRGVSGLRLHIPKDWIPAAVNWNGLDQGTLKAAGCWEMALVEDRAAVPCPAPPAK